MKSLLEAAKEYSNDNPSTYPYNDHESDLIDAFKAGAAYERKRSEILLEALEKLHLGPGTGMASWKLTWAHEFSAAAIKKYKESEGGG